MKQYTMEGFINGEFDVRVGTKHWFEFMRLCKAQNLRFEAGHEPDNPEIFSYAKNYGRGLAVGCGHYHPRTLTYHGDHFQLWEVIDYEKFIIGTNPYQILIDCDGTTTTATMTINGREIKTAIARRNPADKFDWKKGATLAFERLWNSQRKAEKKPAVREVKRWANPGEYIKIVNAADSFHGENYDNGDILQVIGCYGYNGAVNAKGANVAIGPYEYVVLEGYRPYETAAKKSQKED